MKFTWVIASAVLMAMPAWAINKCKGPDGRIVFQDAPCQGQGEKIEVKPASGPGSARAAAMNPALVLSEQKEGAFGANWQRRTYLENRGITDARSALERHQHACQAQQVELSSRKRLANNNVAGATWEQSISTEMQAAATLCDTRSRELRAQLESMERELRELQAQGK